MAFISSKDSVVLGDAEVFSSGGVGRVAGGVGKPSYAT